MRPFRLLVTLALFAAAVAPPAAAVACMLMRSDMSMAEECDHDLVVTGTPSPDDCPVSQCAPPVVAQIPDLSTRTELSDPGHQGEPQRYLRPISWAIAPALPPPKPLPSNS